jgi:hypothetical protein
LNRPAADARFGGGVDVIIDARLQERLQYWANSPRVSALDQRGFDPG